MKKNDVILGKTKSQIESGQKSIKGRYFVKEIDLDHLGESDKKPKESGILGMGVIPITLQTQAKVTFGHDTLPYIQGPNLRQVQADLDQETPSQEPTLWPLSDPKLFGLKHRKDRPLHFLADTLSGSKTCGPMAGSKTLGPISRGNTDLYPRIHRLSSGYSARKTDKELHAKYTSKLSDFDLLRKVPIEEIEVARKDMKKVCSMMNLQSLSRSTDRKNEKP
jgi:hypothetical protein